MSISKISKEISDEINALDERDNMKAFLREILDYENMNVDRFHLAYKVEIKKMANNSLSHD